jgi:hypothetical protein
VQAMNRGKIGVDIEPNSNIIAKCNESLFTCNSSASSVATAGCPEGRNVV